MKPDPARLEHIYSTLLGHHGPQHWWPAESDFEMMVGAILTQNTQWTSVEECIQRLKSADLLSVDHLLACPDSTLHKLLRPVGFFRLKTDRLKSFCHFLGTHGANLRQWSLHQARDALLSVRGVGKETADSMLLYALNHPIFVVDLYTTRFLQRFGLIKNDKNPSYDTVQALFHQTITPNVNQYQEYHALLVAHGKHHCKAKPRCPSCPLQHTCLYPHVD